MNRKLKIGLVGFFGWGNFGDELFVSVHQQRLGNFCELEPINDLTKKPYFSKPLEEVLERYDGLLIGGGDLVVPWALSGLYWKSEFLTKPVFVSGVGVPTWRKANPAIIEKYKEFFRSDAVRHVAVRDAESQAWMIEHIGLSTDISWHADAVCSIDLPPPVTLRKQQKILGIALRDRANGKDSFREVRTLCNRAKENGYQIEHIVLGSKEVGERDHAITAAFAEDNEPIRRSEDVFEICRYISRCSMMASMKFHGTVVATMYGIPSVTMSATDKNRNFLKMIERPDLGCQFNSPGLAERVPTHPVPISKLLRRHLRQDALAGYASLEDSIRREFSLPRNVTA